MKLFYVDNIEWTKNSGDGASAKEIIGLELGRRIAPQKLHIATKHEIGYISQALKKYADISLLKVLTVPVIENLLKKTDFPIALGNPSLEENCVGFEQLLANDSLKNPIKLGILSPFGRNLGDSLMFFTVVRTYKKIASDYDKEIELHLLNSVLPPGVRQTYHNSALFTSITEFPHDVNWLAGIDAYINFTRPHLRYDVPWVDSLLELSGIPPEKISGSLKRNSFDLNAEISAKLDIFWKNFKSEINSPVIIFHRESSTPIRTMPENNYLELLEEFLDLTDYHFVTFTPVKFDHPRFTDLSYLSTGFNEYVKLISLADGFITVDTSLYHFADAFDVPGVVIYTCQPPARFSKYYPFVKGFQIEGGERLELKHWSNDSADIELSDRLWSLLDAEMIVELLNEAMSERLLKEAKHA